MGQPIQKVAYYHMLNTTTTQCAICLDEFTDKVPAKNRLCGKFNRLFDMLENRTISLDKAMNW